MYQLTEDDLDHSPDHDTPIIRAAAKRDSALLEALLFHHAALSGENDMTEDEHNQLQYLGPSGIMSVPAYQVSPIISATNACLPDNVYLLLAAGAKNPNGIDRDNIGDYSVRYIRGRHFKDDINSTAACKPRAFVLANAKQKRISHQICPLAQVELDERDHGFPRFWTEPNVPGQRLRWSLNRALTGLETEALAV